MARRADHTRDELTELAIQAGHELIEKDGFSNFSARKVAAKIGYTVGTLYNVFGSYDHLIMHINAKTLDDWFIAMQSALKKSKSKNHLHTLAKTYIHYSQTNYAHWVALFEHHFDTEREVPEWYQLKMNRFFVLTEELLLPMIKNKRKAQTAAHVLWAGIHGICVLSLSGKLNLVEADSPEILVQSFIDNYLMGITSK